ncbi:hypothetical protein N7532_002243 [Penicillium argentinense]|uniref:FHA domain-containing protein n=1 Tax=Penicillium argentinense TaxID=1131581 RepID=A0A9W9G023_9EURO|nr:uncharacterized protein N7532_002243 [Penicillium argentinense]KAJ5109598.1 hypothetical protein N7532_002243 [Penicillium argentinense]
MWTLEATGDFLNVCHGSASRSISRQHMSIEVACVKSHDGTRTHVRTQITITDLGSSKGTFVDGERITGERILEGPEHSIVLAKATHTLRLKWEPVVLTFSFSSKEMRANDPLAKVRARLEELDIKTIIPYLVDQTTHVVQSKRNTAKGLQALINGKHIVKNSFLDAIEYATTPTDLGTQQEISPLESDFDAAWPDPAEHLPPPGNEPTSRSASAFAPNSDRINVFDKYTFVFGDASQFENLQPAINNGHGKALYYEIKDGETTAADIVQFMKKAGGSQGVGAERTGPGGVVLVRFRSKGDYENWSVKLGNEVALAIDQRSIEQREFLDAILNNDAKPLCRPLPREEVSSQVSPTPTPAVELPQPAAVSEEPSPSLTPHEQTQPAPSRAKSSRERKYVSKMKTFDDGFDMESIPVYEPGMDEPEQSQSMGLDPIEQPQPNQTLPTVEEEEGGEGAEDDAVSDLLPGAQAMKRRRAAQGDDEARTASKRVKTEVAPKPRRRKMDVLEEARKHREEEEKQHEEELHPSQNVDIEKLRNLAIVEEMDIPVRQPPVRENDQSNRWDEQWNGRKNFKRFRRKGEPRHARQRVQSVIVPLEEVTRKDYGIGDHYWSSSSKPSEREQPSQTLKPSASSRDELATSQSQLSVPEASTPNPTPGTQSTLSRSRSQKRPREVADAESEEEGRFRFRRKR